MSCCAVRVVLVSSANTQICEQELVKIYVIIINNFTKIFFNTKLIAKMTPILKMEMNYCLAFLT